VLAAHYDTLQLGHPNKPFIGATDSAASVAILLSLAKMLAVKHCVNHPVSIILFDGEEAFHQWTSDDSVYGSRILAAEWSRTCLPLHGPFSPPAHQTEMTSMKTRLNLIRQLILLDLLGYEPPIIN
jgi:hypothetical protein